jgi:hypothetical protein
MEGKDLPEYVADVSDDGETASCWIPSEPGKVSKIFLRECKFAPTGRVSDGFLRLGIRYPLERHTCTS